MGEGAPGAPAVPGRRALHRLGQEAPGPREGVLPVRHHTQGRRGAGQEPGQGRPRQAAHRGRGHRQGRTGRRLGAGPAGTRVRARDPRQEARQAEARPHPGHRKDQDPHGPTHTQLVQVLRDIRQLVQERFLRADLYLLFHC